MKTKEDADLLEVVEGINLDMVYSETNVLVTNPLGQSIVVNKLIGDCPLVFGKHTFLVDLLMLSFHDFDLTRHNVTVDCRTRRVRLITAKGIEYLLPRNEDFFDQLSEAKIFSKIDLKSSYYHIKIKIDNVPKIAFRSRY
ncbi:Transposon Ty3-I Gag-Pol polyprotein [Gossypium australe]|uniref:Transposon Ty3-I Gag-Pol polyprotein n=1 Tax=Gossypium australe TaxID=47621 RepID=A0A5B6UVH8_9ROSI|nr:Transposon Ty3-I Gag-Pol polyprotein [Gossypium australe]